MLVYGDRREWASPSERLDRLRERLTDVRTMPGGLERHSKLVGALIEVGRLLQGVADAGVDGADELSELTCGLAHNVISSWESGFADFGALPEVPALSG